MVMENSYKRTFDAVSMPQERQEQIRVALSSRISEKRKDNNAMNTKSIVRKKPRTALIAAVIALSFIVLVGFAYGSQIIQLLGGGHIESGKDFVSISMMESYPYEVREGRVYFILDDSGTDITSYCTDETFYQYEQIAGNDYRHIILIGGTPDNLGWAEIVFDENGNHVGSTAIYYGDDAPAWLNNGRVQLGLGVWGGVGVE
jgi:hypothetical protein